MKKPVAKLWCSALCLASAGVMAGEIRCRGELIRDDAREPMLRPEVLEKCGEPQLSDGGMLVYRHDNVRKVLRFNDADELMSITEERAE
jgi:hypothetical protein